MTVSEVAPSSWRRTKGPERDRAIGPAYLDRRQQLANLDRGRRQTPSTHPHLGGDAQTGETRPVLLPQDAALSGQTGQVHLCTELDGPRHEGPTDRQRGARGHALVPTSSCTTPPVSSWRRVSGKPAAATLATRESAVGR